MQKVTRVAEGAAASSSSNSTEIAQIAARMVALEEAMKTVQAPCQGQAKVAAQAAVTETLQNQIGKKGMPNLVDLQKARQELAHARVEVE